jgi:hypothetical protein
LERKYIWGYTNEKGRISLACMISVIEPKEKRPLEMLSNQMGG